MHGVIVWRGLVTVRKSFGAEDPPRPASEVVLPGHGCESADKRLGMNSARGAHLPGKVGSVLDYGRHDAIARALEVLLINQSPVSRVDTHSNPLDPPSLI